VLVSLGIALVLALARGWFFWREPGPATATYPLETSKAVAGGRDKTLAAYAGSESCRECHVTEYGLWLKSNHGLAERAISADMDRTAFEPGRSFKHGAQTSQARVEAGDCQIVTLGFGSNVEPYWVERVMGHKPLRQFLTPGTGGRWQVQEVAYDPKLNQWFDVYGDEDRQPGEFGHWTGRGMNWNSRCAACHNTGLRKNYDEATDTYHTTMAEAGVGCEACHGPLTKHVEWRKAEREKAGGGRKSPPGDRERAGGTVGAPGQDRTVAQLILIRFQDEPNSGRVGAWQDHAGLIHSSLSGRN
jgi:hypothetical protein